MLTAKDVLRRYQEEELPAFCGMVLDDVNQRGNFGEHPLEVAATRGAVEEVMALLEGGADIDARGESGNTALHEAVGQGHVDVVRALLGGGASRCRRNADGRTAADLARLHGRSKLVDMLEAEVLPETRAERRPTNSSLSGAAAGGGRTR